MLPSNKTVAVNRLRPFFRPLRPWVIIFCGALFYAYQFILRVSPNVMRDELMDTFMIDASAFGAVVAFYSWGYAGMQLPLGMTMDRFGPKILMTAAAIICAISCFVMAHTQSPLVAAGVRLCIGAAGACGLIGTLKLGTLWLKPSLLSKVIAITMVFGTLGAAAGQRPLALMVNAFGWRTLYSMLALVGVGIAVLIFIIIHIPKPEGSHEKEANPFLQNRHPWTDLKKLMTNPQAWMVAFYGMVMYMPITLIGDAWGAGFIQTIASVSEGQAASVVTSMFFGAALGSPCFTTFSDIIAKRRIPMMVGSLITLALYLFILLYTHHTLWTLHVLFFAAGFFYTAKVLTFAVICEVMPRDMSGVSTAFVNMIVMLTGAFHFLIGFLMDLSWHGTYKNGNPVYTATDYRFALTVIPVCLGISFLILFFMRETHPKSGSTFRNNPSVDVDVL